MPEQPSIPIAISEPTHVIRPTTPGERIQVIDILRGWAIFGILVVNMLLDFSGYSAFPERWTAPVDQAVVVSIEFLFRMKFVTLFAALFGLGFFLQMTRAESRGVNFLHLYVRRLFVLLILGVLHALMFPGAVFEILHQYALMGFVLLLFRDRSNRTILIAAVVLFLLPFVLQAIVDGIGQAEPAEAQAAQSLSEQLVQAEQESTGSPSPVASVYLEEGFGGIVAFHARQLLRMRSSLVGYVWMLQIVSLFLLGLYAGRRGVLEDVTAHLSFIRSVLWWGLVLGLGLTSASYVPTSSSILAGVPWVGLLGGVAFTFGGPCLALFYASAIMLLVQRTTWKRRLAPLAAVGRMALTNYLLQTLICTSIFYGYGLGFYGTVGPAAGLALTIVIYAVQVVFSVWWIGRFRFGPAEWLWRTLTYGKLQPMRL